MATFTKVRSGISGLKKERDELRKEYEFVAKELEKMATANEGQIKELSGKSESLGAKLAALEERIGQTDGAVDSSRTAISSEISAVEKRLDDHKKTLVELGERLQKAMDAADSAVKGVSDSRKYEKDVSKSIKDMGAGISGLEEKMSSTDGRFVSGMEMVKKVAEGQSAVIKEHDTALEKIVLSIQAIRKDLAAENERIARVRESTSKNAKKLEMLGTLESKIKHIEDVKTGLVKGVESLKDIRNRMAALQQKTKDLDSKLTNADKYLDAKLTEKTKLLDSQIAEKTDVMESQMQERLKFLEENLRDSARSLETKIASDITEIGKELAKDVTDIKKIKSNLEGENDDIIGLKNASAVLSGDVEAIKGRLEKDGASISSMNLDLAGIRKDLSSTGTKLSDLKADHLSTKKKLTAIDALRHRISDVEKLGKTLTESLSEIKALQSNMTALQKDVETGRIKMEDVDAAIESKVNFNISSLKKGTASNAAALKTLEEDLNKFSLDVNSIKKDLASNDAGVKKLRTTIDNIQKKANELEKVSIKLGDMGDAKQALTEVMEAKIEERIKFLETELKQRGDNIEAGLSDKSSAMESRLKGDITAIKKELSGKSRSMDTMKTRLDAMGKLEERIKHIDEEKDVITRNVSSLQDLKTGMTKMDERSRHTDKDLRALKAQVDSGLTDVRSRLETTSTEEGNKFSTAVKAFLNARGELNKKIGMLELKISDSNRRITDFSKLTSRLDLLERKVDRLTERGTEIRRDIDDLERKRESDESVMFVDLNEKNKAQEF